MILDDETHEGRGEYLRTASVMGDQVSRYMGDRKPANERSHKLERETGGGMRTSTACCCNEQG